MWLHDKSFSGEDKALDLSLPPLLSLPLSLSICKDRENRRRGEQNHSTKAGYKDKIFLWTVGFSHL
jgi:hypothetical protein